MSQPRTWLFIAFVSILLFCPEAGPPASGQDRLSQQRTTLLRYVGQDILLVDTTSGGSQFQHSDALLTFRLRLDAVQRDYMIVSRNVEGDKRDFVYPLGVIRRIRTVSDGVPLRPIVVELY